MYVDMYVCTYIYIYTYRSYFGVEIQLCNVLQALSISFVLLN